MLAQRGRMRQRSAARLRHMRVCAAVFAVLGTAPHRAQAQPPSHGPAQGNCTCSADEPPSNDNSTQQNVGATNTTDFDGAYQNQDEFNADLSWWDVSQVTSMGSTFAGASSFASDLSEWDVG